MNNADLLKLEQTAAWLRALGTAPPIGVILGSGLGAFGERLRDARVFPYQDIPHAPVSQIIGHAGKLIVGELDGTRVAVLSGRVHGYEGHALERVVFLARALGLWGVGRMVVTNAAGAVNTGFHPGDLMLIADHLNLMGRNPLEGHNEDALGPRFLDLTRAYDPLFADTLRATATDAKVTLREGVYAALSGPNYETPAEIRMLRTLGADAVGMSTVPEVIALRHLGVRVAALSCITNYGAGITGQTLSHAEVKETADRVAGVFGRLLQDALPRLARS